MHDRNGKTIHVGEMVTLTKEMRPKRLIGRQGTVIGLGDVRINIDIMPSRFGRAESIRVEPNKVVIGKQRIHDPMLDDPLFQSMIKDVLANAVEDLLDKGVAQKIITEDQVEELLDLFAEQ